MEMKIELNMIYSLRPKIIVLPPRFFGPKMIVQFIYPAGNLRLITQMFSCETFIIMKSFDTAISRGVSEQVLFSILRVILPTIWSTVNKPSPRQSQEHGQSFWDRWGQSSMLVRHLSTHAWQIVQARNPGTKGGFCSCDTQPHRTQPKDCVMYVP